MEVAQRELPKVEANLAELKQSTKVRVRSAGLLDVPDAFSHRPTPPFPAASACADAQDIAAAAKTGPLSPKKLGDLVGKVRHACRAVRAVSSTPPSRASRCHCCHPSARL